jgi:hypothetical protein
MAFSNVPAGLNPGKWFRKQLPSPGGSGGTGPEEQATAGERGFVLIGALLILVLLALIGIAATTTTNLELQIAGLEQIHKTTFYRADGGTELGAMVLEENIACGQGFTTAVLSGRVGIDGRAPGPVPNLQFAMNQSPVPLPSDAVRDFHYPFGYADGEPHTNFTLGGQTQLGIGGAMQMAAGYMGKGKAAAGGGASILYDLYIQSIGRSETEALLHIQWRHSLGQEGSCNY